MSASSFQGARRLSARNDDNLSFDMEDTGVKSLAYCDDLAAKLNNVSHLPKACLKYKSVVQKLESKVATNHADMNQAFAGLPPGQAAHAKTARLSGRETQAQFQRRMTRSHKMSR